jgi:SAM-dependent methyltransferase
MHLSSFKAGKLFFDLYAQGRTAATVVDIGAQNVNGSLKELCPSHLKYVGVDFVAGAGVDIVLTDPYTLPFDDRSVDIVVSNSCFEHSEMFWVLFLEVLRILKPNGLFYMNAPSNGPFHRYPVDCWRFYPDAGKALVAWARRSGYDPLLLESYVGVQDADYWNDFIAVFVKEKNRASDFPNRMIDALDSKKGFSNGVVFEREGLINHKMLTEDEEKVSSLAQALQRGAATNRLIFK